MILDQKVTCDKIVVDEALAGERMNVVLEKLPFTFVVNADEVTHKLVIRKGNNLIIYPKARIILEPDADGKFMYLKRPEELFKPDGGQ